MVRRSQFKILDEFIPHFENLLPKSIEQDDSILNCDDRVHDCQDYYVHLGGLNQWGKCSNGNGSEFQRVCDEHPQIGWVGVPCFHLQFHVEVYE